MKFYTIRASEDILDRVANKLYKSNDPLLEMFAKSIDEQMLINKTEENAERKTA